MLDIHVQQLLATGSEQNALAIVQYCRQNNLFHLGVMMGKYLSKIYSHCWNIITETGLCAFYSKDFELAYKLFSTALKFTNLPEKTVKETIFNAHFCIDQIAKKYTYYNPRLVQSLTKKKNNPIPLVTVTMTSCKRYDLFERTVNSFLNCCTDVQLIDHWLCVDDNSSQEDRKKMKEKYPFFKFYFKTLAEKGHPQSMNIIKKQVTTSYIFHMEDDWQFFAKRNYISDCFDVLHTAPNIGQCLINKNYGETEKDVAIIGGHPMKTAKGTRFFTHEYCPDQESQNAFNKKYGIGRHCAYWPHFSFRPSLLRVQILQQLGDFNEEINHFEMDYSDRYIRAGYISAFLESIYCLHTGRLTSERFDKTKTNAYELNNESQFSGKEKKVYSVKSQLLFQTFVINLDRRPDRWEKFQKNDIGLNYVRFPAIDGSKLVSTPQLQRIFDNNDYNMRTGMVGCAISHIKLCVELVNQEEQDFYCILEDDIDLVPNFKQKFVQIISQLTPGEWDMIYLGHHIFPKHRKDEHYDKEANPVAEKWSRAKSLQISMGGTGGYVISKEGAKKLLDFIDRTGMTNGIDTVQQKAADDMNIYYCIPHLIYSECYTGNNKPDTDIQFCYDSLTVDVNTRFMEELRFYSDVVIQTAVDYANMEKIVHDENETKVTFYRDDPQNIVKLKNICVHPCYTLDNQILFVVPKVTGKQRYFHRLKKNNKYDVGDALVYKE